MMITLNLFSTIISLKLLFNHKLSSKDYFYLLNRGVSIQFIIDAIMSIKYSATNIQYFGYFLYDNWEKLDDMKLLHPICKSKEMIEKVGKSFEDPNHLLLWIMLFIQLDAVIPEFENDIINVARTTLKDRNQGLLFQLYSIPSTLVQIIQRYEGIYSYSNMNT